MAKKKAKKTSKKRKATRKTSKHARANTKAHGKTASARKTYAAYHSAKLRLIKEYFGK